MPTSISETVRELAEAEGFAAARITRADAIPLAADRLNHFVAAGHHGTMGWIADTAERRGSPTAMWPEAKSAIMLAMTYGTGLDPLKRLEDRNTGVISVYALGRDYHDVIKGKLKRMAHAFARQTGAEVKVFVDTAPLMEKPLAEAAGLGWQGKHTNLVSRELGSWFFLGAILTAMELPADGPEADHCGSCRACLDICPTQAFPAPYQLDARRCISYLTIEHKGPIPLEFRKAIGNRIYGCDDCLAVCPWNKFAVVGREAKLAARDDLIAPSLAQLAELDDASFRAFFSGSPVKRIGRNRFLRNVLIAIGNSGDAALMPSAQARLADEDEVVREAANWAAAQLGNVQ
jgi:epoxyqueuosine reductase